ncbi:hypothetical protein [Morganella morganii]|uniref:hypothetical protein n=1 Tax=Morganella morganii TaxID=582 RepID=UPI0031B59E12
MNIGELLTITNLSGLTKKELTDTAIYSGAASDNLIEGIGAVGTLMFESSCNKDFNLNNDTLGKLGLLIQESMLIAEALSINSTSAGNEIKSRSAPPCTLRNTRGREMKLLVLLAISTTLSYHYSNLKVIYTKTNQRKK